MVVKFFVLQGCEKARAAPQAELGCLDPLCIGQIMAVSSAQRRRRMVFAAAALPQLALFGTACESPVSKNIMQSR
jgi:hypothetical protein